MYIIYSDVADKSYIGRSSNVDARLAGHNSGNTRSTKPYVPWRIVHVEAFASRLEARKRELYLKSAAGRKWRKKNIDLGD